MRASLKEMNTLRKVDTVLSVCVCVYVRTCMYVVYALMHVPEHVHMYVEAREHWVSRSLILCLSPMRQGL